MILPPLVEAGDFVVIENRQARVSRGTRIECSRHRPGAAVIPAHSHRHVDTLCVGGIGEEKTVSVTDEARLADRFDKRPVICNS